MGGNQNAKGGRHMLPSFFTLALLAMLLIAVHPLTSNAAASQPSCPSKWFEYTQVIPSSSSSATALVSRKMCVRAIRAAAMLAPPIDIDRQCRSIGVESGGGESMTAISPRTVSVHSQEENERLRGLFFDPQDGDEGPIGGALPPSSDDIVVLGGAAGFGDLHWFDGSDDDEDNEKEETREGKRAGAVQALRKKRGMLERSSSRAHHRYSNFASGEDWATRSGCIAMQRDGTWVLVGCTAPSRPYFCSFPFSELPENITTSTAAPGETNSTAAPGGDDEDEEKTLVALRPAVPQPPPPCLAGWKAYTPSRNASAPFAWREEEEQQVGDVCYRFFAPSSREEGDGRRGLPQSQAEVFCHNFHPIATLTSVLSRHEEQWIRQVLLPGSAAYVELARQGRVSLINVGGRFIYHGRIGSWSADTFYYNQSEFDASAPSSPAWPTDANHLYHNWGLNGQQPSPDYGCLALSTRSSQTWATSNCQSDLPFICSYLNDGSSYPSPPPDENSSSASTDSTTEGPVPTDEPEVPLCLDGWTHFAQGSTCYRAFDSFLVSSRWRDGRERVSPSAMEDTCQQVLTRVATDPSLVHAAAVRTPEESAAAGQSLFAFFTSKSKIPIHASSNSSSQPRNDAEYRLRGRQEEEEEEEALRAIIGVAYRNSGASGHYLDGSGLLPPFLAEMLWAAYEPLQPQGCIAVDTQGRWYWHPCDSSSREAAEAFVCQYPASTLRPLKPEESSSSSSETTPSDSSSSVPGPTPDPSPEDPVAGRVCTKSLNGASHLVVSAGTIGVYTMDPCEKDKEEEENTRKEEGDINPALYVYFAPVSPFFEYGVFRSTGSSSLVMGLGNLPLDPIERGRLFGQLLFDTTTYAPCDGFKKQENIFRAQDGRVAVRHSSVRELGYVCVSADGVHYKPSGVTYEVVGASLKGFVPLVPRVEEKEKDGAQKEGREPSMTSPTSTVEWLPPLFYSTEELREMMRKTKSASKKLGDTLAQALAIRRFTSGVLQLYVESSVGPNYNHTSKDRQQQGKEEEETYGDDDGSLVEYIRFSSSEDCMHSSFLLLENDVRVVEVGSAYIAERDVQQQPQPQQRVTEGESAKSAYGITYQQADAIAASRSSLKRLTDPQSAQDEPPVEYYVCVAVRKAHPHHAVLLNDTNTRTTADEMTHMGEVAMDRLRSLRSMGVLGEPVTLYTVVPGLKVHVTAPPVSVQGMWALSPRPTQRASLARIPAVQSNRICSSIGEEGKNRYRDEIVLCTGITCGTGKLNPDALGQASRSSITVPQYSSPVILLDGAGLQEGMSVLLSRDKHRCDREQESLATAMDPSMTAAAGVPAYLDTMVPISVVEMDVYDYFVPQFTEEGERRRGDKVGESADVVAAAAGIRYRNVKSTKQVPFIQLNTNHTGMWGSSSHNDNGDGEDDSVTWYVCLSYATTTSFVSLKSLEIRVQRQSIDGVTASSVAVSSSGVGGEEQQLDPSSASVHLNVNVGFAGLLKLWGMDMSMWSEATIQGTQVAFMELSSSAVTSKTPMGSGTLVGQVCPDSALAGNAQRVLGIVPAPRVISGDYDDTHSSSSVYERRRTCTCPDTNCSTSAATEKQEEGGEEGELESSFAAVVIPQGYFPEESSWRLQLCLSVPRPFSVESTGRVFYATAATVDVRPIELLFVGRYGFNLSSSAPSPSSSSAIATPNTVVTIAEESENVVFPLIGYGLRPDMTVFFSKRPCYGQTALVDPDLARRQSVLNLTVTTAYDLPSNYWASLASDVLGGEIPSGNSSSSGTSKPSSLLAKSNGGQTQPLFITLTKSEVTTRAIAERLFSINEDGSPSLERRPLHMCLYAPGTRREVFPTAFRLVVKTPYVASIYNNPHDIPLIDKTLRRHSTEESSVSLINGLGTDDGSNTEPDSTDKATVIYAAYMDIIVEGFGLKEGQTRFIPAVDCSNISSFLWRAPVAVSAIPSGTIARGFSPAERYVDPQTSMSSWFIPLNQAHTTRVGAKDWPFAPSAGGTVSRFVWCVRYDDDGGKQEQEGLAGGNENDDSGSAGDENDRLGGFVSTGIPYSLAIPAVDGFKQMDGSVTQELVLPTQDSELGQWQSIHLVGPVVDFTFAVGNPLYMFLAEEGLSCKAIKNYYLEKGLLAEKLIIAVDGSAVMMPNHMTSEGIFKFCTSAVYPNARSATLGIESALQFFELGPLRLRLVKPVYSVLSLNHTRAVTVEQGQEWTLPITGTFISNASFIRFKRFGESCEGAMTADGALEDIAVHDIFEGLHLFGKENSSENGEPDSLMLQTITNSSSNNSTLGVNPNLYVVLERGLIRALAAPEQYQLCFKANRATPWQASATVTLTVVEHIRRPTEYAYFAADGSDDVTAVLAVPPTKVALPWITGEAGRVNMVGAAGHEVAVALWCPGEATSADSGGEEAEGYAADAPCGDHRRVMFVKPMEDGSDPCFFDAEAVQEDIVRGPYVIDYGVLTIPASMSKEGVHFYPNVTQPWIMCLETGPERWRQPRNPLFQLQLATATPIGFRDLPDDFSNTSATFVWTQGKQRHSELVLRRTEAGQEIDLASHEVALGEVGGEDRMYAEGNQTLLLHAEDSSTAFYLNGYAIQRGYLMRFGANCEADVFVDSTTTTMQAVEGSSNSSSSSSDGGEIDPFDAAIIESQKIANPLLYRHPLLIEDDRGLFLMPRAHMALEQARPVPMCLSTDGGFFYTRTLLSLAILPSRLIRDNPEDERDLLQRIFAYTVVVARNSSGEVDLTSTIETALASARKDPSAVPVWPLLPVGTRVRLATTCDDSDQPSAKLPGNEDEEEAYVRLPEVWVSERPNVIRLTAAHTAAKIRSRLRVCAVMPAAETAGERTRTAEEQSSKGRRRRKREGKGKRGTGVQANASRTSSLSSSPFVDTGLRLKVLDVSIASVTVHRWGEKTAQILESRQDDDGQGGIREVVLRRADEELMLTVTLKSGSGSESGVVCRGGDGVGCLVDRFLYTLDTSAPALPFFSLARFRLGRTLHECLAPPPKQEEQGSSSSSSSAGGIDGKEASSQGTSAEAAIVTFDAMKAEFSNTSLRVSALDSVFGHFVAPLSQIYAARGDVHVADPWAPASLCLSVDGGRHYMSVGIAYFTADWAPTLMVSVDNSSSSVAPGEITASPSAELNLSTLYRTDIHAYQYTSVSGMIADTRYSTRLNQSILPLSSSTAIANAAVNTFLGDFTSHALWTGFFGRTGFAIGGLLFLGSDTAFVLDTTQALLFAVDYVRSGIETGLHVVAERWSLLCLGNADFIMTDQFVQGARVGALLAADAAQCVRGLPGGTTLRIVGPLGTGLSSDGMVGQEKGTTTETDEDAEAALQRQMAELCGGLRHSTRAEASWAFNAFVMWPQAFSWRAATMQTVALAAALQMPSAGKYVADGMYGVCIEQMLPYGIAAPVANSSATASAAYYPTPVRLHVTSGALSVSVVARAKEGTVAVFQGTNAALPLQGTAVHLPQTPVLVALAPASSRVVPVWSSVGLDRAFVMQRLNGNCGDVSTLRDPVSGKTRLAAFGHPNRTDGVATAADILMATPWYNGQHGWLRIAAGYTRYLTNTSSTASYLVCYSVDYGLSFQPVIAIGADQKMAVTLAVLPPTITGVAAMPPIGNGRGTSVEEALSTVPSAARVQRQYLLPSQQQPGNSSEAAPWDEVIVTTTVNGHVVLARAPRFYANDTNGFVGNGIGLQSGREKAFDSEKKKEENTAPLTAETMPTVAGAVAVLRSSVHGSMCSGTTLANLAAEGMSGRNGGGTEGSGGASPLALPIFIVNLHSGYVWSEKDTSTLRNYSYSLSSGEEDELVAMINAETNPVLANSTWLANTQELQRKYGASGGVVSVISLLGLIQQQQAVVQKAANMLVGESFVVCVSTDGKHFYSANAASSSTSSNSSQAQLRNGSAEGKAQEAATVELSAVRRLGVTAQAAQEPTALSHVPSSALLLMPNVEKRGTNYVRDVSLLAKLLVRPNLTKTHNTSVSSSPFSASTEAVPPPLSLELHVTREAVVRLQYALARRLGIDDASVLLVQLQGAGSVVVEEREVSDSVAVLARMRYDRQQQQQGLDDASSSFSSSSSSSLLSEKESGKGEGKDEQSVYWRLPVYALTLSVAADTHQVQATNGGSRALLTAPEVLFRAVQLLLKDAETQHELLAHLLPAPPTRGGSHRLAEARENEGTYVSIVTMNFTLATGVDLHREASVTQEEEVLEVKYPQTDLEKRWRSVLLAIPYDAVLVADVPDGEGEGSGSMGSRWRVTWWSIPLMLLLPIALAVTTYFVYKKFLRTGSSAPETAAGAHRVNAEDVTIEEDGAAAARS